MNFVTRFGIFALIATVVTYNTPTIFFSILEWSVIQWFASLFKTILFIVSVGVFGAIAYPYLNKSPPKRPILEDKYFGKTVVKAGEQIPRDPEDIEEFKVEVSEDVLQDLNQRIDSSRFVEPIAGTNFNYGFNGDYLREVVKYWRNEFDWRKQETELNRFPQFTTQISGLKIHFIHVKPTEPAKTIVPLLVVHGWPGSVWEYYKSFPLLTKATNDIAFEVICPSIPGYGFSEAPHQTGFNSTATARIFVKLMKRLNHDKFFVHGGDWGSLVSKQIAKHFPQNVLGMHVTMGTSVLSLRGKSLLYYIIGAYFPSWVFENPDKDYKKVYPFWSKFFFTLRESGYFHIQATKPDTVGAALINSPVGLAAYILEKFSTWTNPRYTDKPDGGLTEKFTLDELLTNVMIYWVSNNVTSSLRYYKENMASPGSKLPITVPSAMADFPNELVRSPKSFVEVECHNLVQYTEMPSGGHFGAFEEPNLLTNDIRKFVKTVLQN